MNDVKAPRNAQSQSSRRRRASGRADGSDQLGELEFSDWYETPVFEPDEDELMEEAATSGHGPRRLMARMVLARDARRAVRRPQWDEDPSPPRRRPAPVPAARTEPPSRPAPAAAATKPVDATPTKPVATTPAKPVAATKPVATTPAKPVATTPAKPVDATPTKPVATTPAKPVETIPAKPAAAAPAKPPAPTKPAAAPTPTKPVDATPTDPIATIPTKPVAAAAPAKPVDATPTKPVDTIPTKAAAAAPAKPPAPTKPAAAPTPNKPVAATPTKPATPAKPAAPTKPATATADQPAMPQDRWSAWATSGPSMDEQSMQADLDRDSWRRRIDSFLDRWAAAEVAVAARLDRSIEKVLSSSEPRSLSSLLSARRNDSD